MTTRKGKTLPAEPEDRNAELTEQIAQLERRIIGCLLEQPERWDDQLPSEQFTLADHRKILAAIAECRSKGYVADLTTVCINLGDAVDAGYVASLIAGVIPENYRPYVRGWRDAIGDRDWQQQSERLPELTTSEDRLAALERMTAAINGNGQAPDWRSIFHTREEIEAAQPLEFAIEGWLQCDGTTLIGGLSGHGKTLIMLSMVRALLTGEPLFGYAPFNVPRPAKRVLYLIPESAKDPFAARLASFKLTQFYGDRLWVRTLSSPGTLGLGDARLLTAVEGADVVLDTAVRFMSGSENDAENSRLFAEDLFRLLSAGARSVTGAHHAPKSFANADYMSLENILRGSGDIGAMLCTAWGTRQIDPERNRIWVENVKPRDFRPCQPFILEGRPHIDQGADFKLYAAPGSAGELKDHVKNRAGRPETEDKQTKLAQALELRQQGESYDEIAKAIGTPKSTVIRWISETDFKNGKVTQ